MFCNLTSVNSSLDFESKRSWLIELLLFVGQWYKISKLIDQRDANYSGLEKTFDDVDHGILLGELYTIGFQRRAIELLRWNSGSRGKPVRVNGPISFRNSDTSDVPQQSVSTNLLFVFCINYLPNNCETCQPWFCDDAKLNVNNKSSLQSSLD